MGPAFGAGPPPEDLDESARLVPDPVRPDDHVARAAGRRAELRQRTGSDSARQPGNNSATENVDFADIDGDGDYDAVFADGGDSGNDRNRLWVNQGGLQVGTVGTFVDMTGAQFPNVQDTSRDVDFVDIDNDGDEDIYVSNTSTQSNQSNRFHINQGGLQGGTMGFFVDETSTRWINVGVNDGTTTFSSVAASFALPSGGFIDFSCDCVFGDLDNDGDSDLVHTTYGGIFGGDTPSRLFLNDGGGFYEEFNPSGFQLSNQDIFAGDPGLWCEGTFQHATTATNGSQCDIADTPLGVEIGNLDADWDIDILHGARNEVPRIFQNRLAETGALAPFRDVTHDAESQLASGGGNYEQELGDLDNDNDLDIYGLNWSGLSDIVCLNDGTNHFGAFTVLSGSGSDDNEGDWLDYNNDGYLDIFVANFSGQDRLYENGGPPGFAFAHVTSTELPVEFKTGLGADSADVDNDGDYDLMVCNDGGQANELLENVNGIPDATAPRVVLEQVAPADASAPVAVRAEVYDNASWDVQRYNATVLEYTVNGGPVQSVPMIFAGGQSWRGEIPAGTTGNVSYTALSTDFVGNTGVSPTLAYSIEGVVAYCTAGTSASGCQALLSSSGTPSATAPSGFTVTAGTVEGLKDGLFFFGTNGPQANSWGNGTSYQCVVPPTVRTPTLNSGGALGACDGSASRDMNALWAAVPVKNPGPGAQVDLQYWYRDPLSTSNQTTSFSDALEFTVQP